MGHQVKMKTANAILGLLVLTASPASAQDGAEIVGQVAPDRQSTPERHALGIDFLLSTDADNTDVYRAGADLDFRYEGQDKYLGIRLEKAWFKPLGQRVTGHERAYLRYADKGDHWSWNGRIGTDGDTVLGAATIHNDARYRQEYFIERDIIETPRGVGEGIYYTFAGAAIDLPVDDRNSFTVVGGAQEFTGKNVRLHARATYIHVIKPDWGLSAQLRTRYFHSTKPGEYDYYSPRWYAQALPILQLRRYSNGWRYMVAGGVGAQRDSASGWRSSRFFATEVTSPNTGRDWLMKAGLQYSNTPFSTGAYDYLQVSLALTRVF